MLTEFLRRVRDKDAVIGVVGMGYVGLPLALRFAECGFDVIGFDIDQAKVNALHAGKSYIATIPAERVAAVRRKPSGLHATTEFILITECDAVLLCVPTPLGPNREPDMSYVESTARSIAPNMREGQLIVLESTTYPGTTDELLRGVLERQGWEAGKDFWLAYSPEREDPGNPKFETQTIPKVVGGLTPDCLEAAAALYGAVLNCVIPVRNLRVAEMTKLLENIFRSVNIALVNELKMLCDAMGIDIWEVIEAASSKPFGFMPFYPGPGLGGHCIPIDPFYLTWKAREYDLNTRFIELAGEVNTAMPHYVVHRLVWALNQRGIALRGSRVMILGVAYKPNVDDVRESPAFKIMELVQRGGAEISYYDPFVPKLVPTRHYNFNMTCAELSDVERVDVVVIVTDHGGVPYDYVAEQAPLVIDTRNATRAYQPRANIVKA